MAPRRRSKKRGTTRMDAALDAMERFGFSRKCTRQNVNELLKVYGGDDGWVFIEEDSYSLLLEKILEKQNNSSPEKLMSKDASQNDARGLNDTATLTAGPSCEVTDPICSELEVVNTESEPNVALDTLPHSPEALDFEAHTNEAGAICNNIPPMGEERRGDSNVDKHDENAHTHSTKPADFLSSRRRGPCHGWICGDGDDNDDDDLMDLTPAPLPEGWEKLLRQIFEKKKRKTRWDVRPEDL